MTNNDNNQEKHVDQFFLYISKKDRMERSYDNVIATYQINASYTGELLNDYSVIRLS